MNICESFCLPSPLAKVSASKKCRLQHHNLCFSKILSKPWQFLFSYTSQTEDSKWQIHIAKTTFKPPAVCNSHPHWKSELPSLSLSFSLHSLWAFYVSPSTGIVLQTCWEKTLYFKGQVGKRQHNLHLVLTLGRVFYMILVYSLPQKFLPHKLRFSQTRSCTSAAKHHKMLL